MSYNNLRNSCRVDSLKSVDNNVIEKKNANSRNIIECIGTPRDAVKEIPCKISILSFNVHGLEKQEEDFFEYLETFHIFALYETHVMEFIDELRSKFDSFTIMEMPAVRTAARGRGSDGLLIGFKSELNNVVCMKKVGPICYFEINCSSWGQDKYYIVPQYLNYGRWEEDFEKCLEFLGGLDDTNKVLLVGDLNGRVGRCESHLSFKSEVRSSKDVVINERGRKLLDMCNCYGLAIANGCSKSDSVGNITFVGGSGCSVIDYCLVGTSWEDFVEDVKVDSQEFSDHFPVVIEVILKVHNSSAEPVELNLDPKLRWNNKVVDKYCRLLDNRVYNIYSNPTVEELDIIVKDCAAELTSPNSMLRKRPPAKNPWFDWQCYNARKKKFQLLLKWRKNNEMEILNRYRASIRDFKLLVEEKKRQYEEGLVGRLCNSKDSFSLWKNAKELRGGNKNNCKATLGVGILMEHFQTLLNPNVDLLEFQTAWPGNHIDCLDREITFEEVTNVLKNSSDKKAPGINRIPNEFYKYGSDNFKEMLRRAFNQMFETGNVSPDYLKTIIFPIHKKGSKTDPANYRGICFQNAPIKDFTGILHTRLMNWVEDNNILSPYQAGFRKGYSTVDQIFTLTTIVKHRLENKQKTYAFFIDFKTAFDHVQRNLLFYKLAQKGISFKFLRMIRALYENTTACVWNGEKISASFETKFGIKQGCNISPLLFSLFIDDLKDYLPGGIDFGGINVKILLYADDIVLFSKSPDTLQLMINRVESYCTNWGLTVNIDKSKVMIFRNGFGRYGRNERWFYKRIELEVVREYTYLGFKVTSNLNIEKHLVEKAGEAKALLAITWRRCMDNRRLNPNVKHQLFKATSVMTLLYAAPCFGYLESDTVENLQRYYLKRSLKLPVNTPNYMLTLETGLPNLSLTALKLHFDYVLKLLRNDRDKLSKTVAQHVVNRKSLWFKIWLNKAEEVGMELDLNLENVGEWKGVLYSLLNKLHYQNIEKCHRRAVESQSRFCYPILNHALGEYSYFNSNLSSEIISSIFKLRGELVRLNYMPHRNDLPRTCSLCNGNDLENIPHFLGKCSGLKEIRKQLFNSYVLSDREIIEYLNGREWIVLHKYLQEAWSFRKNIMLVNSSQN